MEMNLFLLDDDIESEPFRSNDFKEIEDELKSSVSNNQHYRTFIIIQELNNGASKVYEFDLSVYNIANDLQEFILDEILFAYTDSIPPFLDHVSYILEPEKFVKHYEEKLTVMFALTNPLIIELDKMKDLADLFVLINYCKD